MGNKKAREFQQEQALRDQWHRARTVPRDPDDIHLPTHGQIRYQLLCAPSFDPGYAWHACEAEPHWRLYRSQVITERLQTRLIGLEELAAPHDPQTFFARLQMISMPIAPLYNNMAGTDGTMYELALFGDLHSQVRFRWWSDPPPHWQPLVSIAEEMLALFRKSNPI